MSCLQTRALSRRKTTLLEDLVRRLVAGSMEQEAGSKNSDSLLSATCSMLETHVKTFRARSRSAGARDTGSIFARRGDDLEGLPGARGAACRSCRRGGSQRDRDQRARGED